MNHSGKAYSDDWDDPIPASALQTSVAAAPATAAPSIERAAPPLSASAALAPSPERPRVPMRGSIERNMFPRLFARSAVFAAGAADDSALPLRDVEAYAAPYEGCVQMSGPRLSARDKTVWEAAARAASEHGWADEAFPVSISEICRAIGRGANGASIESVKASLKRLARAEVWWDKASGRFGGRMLLSAKPTSRGFEVAFDPRMIRLFDEDASIECAPMRHKGLARDLSRWLLDFALTHNAYDKGFELGRLARVAGFEGDATKFASMALAAGAKLAQRKPGDIAAVELVKKGKRAAAWRLVIKPVKQVAQFDAAPEDRKRRANPSAPRAAPARPAPVRRRGVAL